MRVRVSDPKPSHCSMCFRGPDENTTFYDCMAAFDAGTVIDRHTQAFVSGSDDLHICEGCVRELTEAAAFKPVQHQNLLRELDRLRNENSHWRSYAKRLEATLQERPEPAPRKR